MSTHDSYAEISKYSIFFTLWKKIFNIPYSASFPESIQGTKVGDIIEKEGQWQKKWLTHTIKSNYSNCNLLDSLMLGFQQWNCIGWNIIITNMVPTHDW